MVRYRTLKEELQLDIVRSDALRQALAAEDTQANASLYLLLRAVDRFHSTYNRFPGTFDGCALSLRPMQIWRHGSSVEKSCRQVTFLAMKVVKALAVVWSLLNSVFLCSVVSWRRMWPS